MLNYPTRGWSALWDWFPTKRLSVKLCPSHRVVFLFLSLKRMRYWQYWVFIFFHPTFCILLSSFLPFKCLAFGCCLTSFFRKHFRGDLVGTRSVDKNSPSESGCLASGCYDAPKHRLLWWGPRTRKKHCGAWRGTIYDPPVTSTWFYQTNNPSSNQLSKSIRPSSLHLHSSVYTMENWKSTHCKVKCLNSMSRATVPPVPP